MKKITAADFYRLVGIKENSHKAYVSRGEVALAFGTSRPNAGGVFLDLDVVASLLTDELTPAFSRKTAATLIRAFADVWLHAVTMAEAEAEPAFLIVAEFGAATFGRRGETREGVNIGAATLAEAWKAMQHGKKVADRMTFVNVTSLLRDLRSRAAKEGIDLPEVFVPRDDPAFMTEMEDFRARREAHAARVIAARTTP
jgi:hypothetical protein